MKVFQTYRMQNMLERLVQAGIRKPHQFLGRLYRGQFVSDLPDDYARFDKLPLSLQAQGVLGGGWKF